MKTSVIIPTLNRSASLRLTLNSLLDQPMDRDCDEIVVVDNASVDDTRDVVEKIIREQPERRIVYCHEPVPGLLSGRHRGFYQSAGDVLIFIDDDIYADAGWLNAIKAAFMDPDVHLVGGKNLPEYQSDTPEWLKAFWKKEGTQTWCDYLSVLDFGNEPMDLDPLFIWGLNFSIRRQALISLGGFHPDYVPKPYHFYHGNSETGLAIKAHEKGLKIVYQPAAVVRHRIPESRLSIDYFEKRMFLYGMSDSYTDIRLNRAINADWKLVEPIPACRSLWRKLRSRLSRDPYAQIKQQVSQAWWTGYAFHQKKVLHSPELLDWVLKENYWDYRYGPYKSTSIDLPSNLNGPGIIH